MVINKRALLIDIIVIFLIVIIHGVSFSFDKITDGRYIKWGSEGFYKNISVDNGVSFLPQLDGGWAIPEKINTKESLIAFLKKYYQSSKPQLNTGASYILNTMLSGRSGGVDKYISKDEWLEIESRINNTRIEWNTSALTCFHNYYQGDAYKDVAMYVDCRSEPVIVFRDGAGKKLYSLMRRTGSPVGSNDTGWLPGSRDFGMTSVDRNAIGDFNVFIDDNCSDYEITPRVGILNPGFQVVVNSPRYRAIRQSMPASESVFSRSVVTFNTDGKMCYYF